MVLVESKKGFLCKRDWGTENKNTLIDSYFSTKENATSFDENEANYIIERLSKFEKVWTVEV